MSSDATPTDDRIDVAIDVGPLYGHRTGVAVATAGFVEGLSRRSDVTLDPYLVSFRSKLQSGHRRLPLPGQVAAQLWSRSSWPKADRWMASADVVHGTNYVVPPTSVPTVVSVYDCWFLEHPELASSTVKRAGKRLGRAIAEGAHVHASSHHGAQRVREIFGTERVTAINLGPPPALPLLSDLSTPERFVTLRGHPLIVAVGTEERRKGLSLLVEAFGMISPDHRDCTLVLAGAPGDDTTQITGAIAALPADTRDKVLRLGAIDESTKQWLLRSAAVVAYPSIDEGFGFPILEGQLAGTPVVATRVGSIPEIAGDGALLIDGREPSSFATGLVSALDDGTRRLGLIEAGHRNIRRFSWDVTGDQLVGLYTDVIATQ